MVAKRYGILDFIRGLILISMIAYHAVWDMVYIFGEQWMWYKSDFAYLWQQSICWGFILLSGFCWSLGKRKLKRGFQVYIAGILVSAVTLIVMPTNVVICGVLTLIGTCMLLMVPLEMILCKMDCTVGLVLSVMLFVVTRNINKGALGFEKWEILQIPSTWYGYVWSNDASIVDWISTCIGLTAKDFYSSDYFSVFPWLFLFIMGYFLYRIVEKNGLLTCMESHISVTLEWIGKHSLIIYMLHQPIIYSVLALWYFFKAFC